MSFVRNTAAMALATIVATGIGAASAQQGQPSMPMMGPMMGMMGDHGMMGMMGPNGMMPMMGQGMMCGSDSHIEGRLAYIKTELRITDAQASQWDAFAKAFRTNIQNMAQQCSALMGQAGSHMGMMAGTLPERLDQMEQHMALHLEALRAMKSAVQPLYAVLSDEQKRVADQVIHGPMMM
jgi:LTXXQ motif family protein